MNPLKDFIVVPPGKLALECMLFFSKNHPEEYTKVCITIKNNIIFMTIKFIYHGIC